MRPEPRADETLALEPLLDRDTAGVPGSPAISDTILTKITRSDIFVADVTLITPQDSKRPAQILTFFWNSGTRYARWVGRLSRLAISPMRADFS